MNENSTLANYLAGATAGLFSRLVCHPIDTCKSRIQSGSTYFVFSSTVGMMKSTWRLEGISGLYRGFVAAAVGGIPAVSLYLTTYESCKRILEKRFPSERSQFVVYMFSGMAAESVSCILFVPIDVVKERLQCQCEADNRPKYKGSWDALKKIVRQEGLRGIYKGYFATLLAYGPFSALYFMFYENFKLMSSSLFAHDVKSLGFGESLVCSATAGSLSSFLTNPLDMAKLRIQVDRASMPGDNFRGNRLFSLGGDVFALLRKIYVFEGMKGLFRGAGARVLFHTPNTALTMAMFEQCRKWWSEWLP